MGYEDFGWGLMVASVRARFKSPSLRDGESTPSCNTGMMLELIIVWYGKGNISIVLQSQNHIFPSSPKRLKYSTYTEGRAIGTPPIA